MRVLLIGDIVGRPGRVAVEKLLPGIKQRYELDLIIANAENASGGFGITPDIAQEIHDMGVHVLTSGNHIWAQREIIPYIEGEVPLVRPLNYPPGVPGKGYVIQGRAMVVNLMGRTFMTDIDCPFRAMDKLLSELKTRPPVIIVDFHAEATSEKMAMGRYLDGRVSAVLGTHTHVGTIDTQILTHGTAYVTDVGMTGPTDSIIGDDPEAVLRRFLTGMPHRLSVGTGKPVLNAVMVEVAEDSGRATRIERISQKLGE